jgi:hypothetical protein
LIDCMRGFLSEFTGESKVALSGLMEVQIQASYVA